MGRVVPVRRVLLAMAHLHAFPALGCTFPAGDWFPSTDLWPSVLALEMGMLRSSALLSFTGIQTCPCNLNLTARS